MLRLHRDEYTSRPPLSLTALEFPSRILQTRLSNVMAEVKRHGLTKLYAPPGAADAEYGGLTSSHRSQTNSAAVSYLCMDFSAIHISLGPRNTPRKIKSPRRIPRLLPKATNSRCSRVSVGKASPSVRARRRDHVYHRRPQGHRRRKYSQAPATLIARCSGPRIYCQKRYPTYAYSLLDTMSILSTLIPSPVPQGKLLSINMLRRF